MNAGAKLGAYGLVLAAALGGGAGLGGAVGPIDVSDEPAHDEHEDTPMDPTTAPSTNNGVGGLAVAQNGYRLVTEDRLADEGEFAFTIEGPDGSPVTAFDIEHDKQLHLIVASRDLTEFEHVHPDLDADGRWTVDLPELAPGSYRAFADFRPTGAASQTLGIDLVAPGTITAPAPIRPSRSAEVDGYEVALEGGLVPGRSATIEVSVRRNGQKVVTEPYLGARGHLVALRDGDLAYLHVHPVAGNDGTVRFVVEVPTAGSYALFFDFAHGGAVHTARFAVDAGGDQAGAPAPITVPEHADDDAGHAHD